MQRAPKLIFAIKAAVDRDGRPGRFILIGSSDLLRLEQTSERLESGLVPATYVRVDPVGGPVPDSSVQGRADPIALSAPSQIMFLPFDQVGITTQASMHRA